MKIFEHTDYVSYLSSALGRRGPARSLTVLARRLGYRSPRSVGMVLEGTRYPSFQMVNRLSRLLDHAPDEHRYFELLVELKRRKTEGRPTDGVVSQLTALHRAPPSRTLLDEKKFAFVAEWYHYAIKQLIQAPDFKPCPKEISRRLGGKVSPGRVKEALGHMETLGIVESRGGTFRVREGSIVTTMDVPSAALKRHHLGMLQRAADAVTEQDVSRREITSLTIRFKPERIEEAKANIRKFRDEMDARFGDDPEARDVYQLNIQFFSHTLC